MLKRCFNLKDDENYIEKTTNLFLIKYISIVPNPWLSFWFYNILIEKCEKFIHKKELCNKYLVYVWYTISFNVCKYVYTKNVVAQKLLLMDLSKAAF